MQHVSPTGLSLKNGSSTLVPGSRFGGDPLLVSLRSSWPNLIADLSFKYGDFYIVADTLALAPKVSPNANWVQIAGKSNVGEFNIYMPANACAELLEISDLNLELSKLESADAALILEHLLTEKLNLLESVLHVELSFIKIVDVTLPVHEELFGFDLDFGSRKHSCALSIQGELKDMVEGLCAQHASPDEKNIDPKLIVHLGPVLLPAQQAYLARKGEAIDCGVNPSDTIKGVLMRSDGCYWPIYIEDEEIEIVGALTEPVMISDDKPEQIFVTFGLGEISLNAFNRSKLEIGKRLWVSRIPDNEANIYYQTKPFGQGHLSILGANLAVTLDRIGTFTV